LELKGFKKYFFNISWLAVMQIFHLAASLTVGIYVVHYLGPERFGLLSYATSLALLFMTVTHLGLDGISIRELVKDEAKRDQLLGTVFFLKLTAAFLVLAVLCIVACSTSSNDGLAKLLVIVISLSGIFYSFSAIDFYFQSKVLSKYVVFSQFAALLIISAAKSHMGRGRLTLESGTDIQDDVSGF